MAVVRESIPSAREAYRGRSRGVDGWAAFARIGVFSAVLALSACAIVKPPEPVPAPPVVTLPEWMHQAETALAAGDKDKARDAYRSAAKVEPTSKEPWLKLAQSYFESGDYGNAILASQEVLNRDTAGSSDSVAAGILAVSGLRVSTAGLTVLRQQNNLTGGTRGEAETLAKTLRELLGEPVVVPPPPPPPPPPHARVRPRAKTAAITPAAAASAPAAKQAATPGASPFDKLK